MGPGYRSKGKVLAQSQKVKLPAEAPTGHWQVMTRRLLHTCGKKIKSTFHSTSSDLVRGLRERVIESRLVISQKRRVSDDKGCGL